MQVIADLHIHGPHSRATSRDITVENLEKYARMKGLGLLGTGDFTHPLWLKDLKAGLNENGSGILKTKTGFDYILSTEVANIYEQDKKSRKIHNTVYAPDFDTVDQINEFLSKHSDLNIDGRPMFYGLTCPELIEGLMSISKDIVVIPAHVWTPWFGVFGSKSGFDSIEECYKDQSRHIFALETGLSSDPSMNWRLSALDKYSLVSNSDAHSHWPWRIGREANMFDLEKLTYSNLFSAIREKSPEKFIATIEVDPAYGKYHLDGHRNCNTRLMPEESRKMNKTCPVCRKTLTIGVLHRVDELADRSDGFVPPGAVPYKTLIPLTEIISTVTGIDQLYSKKIWEIYNRLIKRFSSEFNVLLKADFGDLKEIVNEKLAELIIKVRNNSVVVNPGYDGVYGELSFKEKPIEENINPQKSIGSFF